MKIKSDQAIRAFHVIFETCRDYPSTGHGLVTNSERSKTANAALETIGSYFEERLSLPKDWHCKVSKGAGAFPKIPWVLFCPKALNAPKEGVYICITFSLNGKGAVAGSIVATAEKSKYRDKINKVPDKWLLSINGAKPNTKYKDAYINPKPFYAKDEPKELLNKLYTHLKNSVTTLTTPTPSFVEPSDFKTPTDLDPCILASLLTKPFTILTGASGTGKTKLATHLAKYLGNTDGSNSEIVAVGADWTDNRSVLGFVNHLNADDEGPRYQSTPILDLLLRAIKDPDVPYFLILDEMNLSHVERYFADFLSAMEQKDGTLKLHSESTELRRAGRDRADVPAELPYPLNLFVIGTVNIDETTYMFSPKVLDRANVIEFTVSEKEMAAFLEEPHNYPGIEAAEPGVAEGFLQLAIQARSMDCDALPEEPAEAIGKHLLELFNILKAERFEFAYRTAKEINIYLQVCRHLAEDTASWDTSGWREDLDHQIMQKLLPKLHGSAGRIGKLLAKLAHYCNSGAHKPDAPIQLSAAAELELDKKTVFPRSLAKLQSMIRTLQDEQFVSFIQ